MPITKFSQKTDEKCSIEASFFWTNAAPKPMSIKSTAKLEKIVTIPTKPNEAGLTKCAKKIPKIKNIICEKTWSNKVHFNPVLTFAFKFIFCTVTLGYLKNFEPFINYIII